MNDALTKAIEFRKRHMYAEALENVKLALKLEHGNHNILGHAALIIHAMGDFEKAISYYEQILSVDKNNLELTYNYFSVLFSARQFEKMNSEIIKLSASGNFTKNQLAGLYVRQAMAKYLAGDIAGSSKLMSDINLNLEIPDKFPDFDALKAFHRLLGGLINYWAQRPDELQEEATKKIYLIGDSHVLSVANAVVKIGGENHRCISFLNTGCKAWHLAMPAYNQYKRAAEMILDNIPAGSKVVVSFGEIDCRLEGGIFANRKNASGTVLEAYVKGLVYEFVKYISGVISPKNNMLVFSGVPACNADINHLNKADMNEFLDVARRFNQHLQEAVEKSGGRYMDLYSITDSGNGRAGGEQYLDNFHLSPETYLPALERAF